MRSSLRWLVAVAVVVASVLILAPTLATAGVPPHYPFHKDPCPTGGCGGDGGGGGGSDPCQPCTDCYASAVRDKNDGLKACAELGNPPGCVAGVLEAYADREQYCRELCAEGNC